MAEVRIPRSSHSPHEACYARLVRRIERADGNWMLEGRLFRPGARVEESELWPSDEYPSVPLLFEYAGRDLHAGLRRPFGGGRAVRPRLYLLWRWERERREWMEVVRLSGAGNEWIERMTAVIGMELARHPRPATSLEVAERAFDRVIERLEGELARLEPEERSIALGFLYQDLTARVAELGPA